MFLIAQNGVDRKLRLFRVGAGDRVLRAGFPALRLVREKRALGAKQRINPETAPQYLNGLVGAD